MTLSWLRRAPGGMDPERTALKAELYRALATPMLVHGRYTYVTQCQLCGAVFSPSLLMPALHELVLERDDVQGAPPAVQYAVLHTDLNLTLVCNEPCNIKLCKDSFLREYLLHRQSQRYGAGPIADWIRSLGLKDPGPYVRRLELALSVWGPQGAERLTSRRYVERRQQLLADVRACICRYGHHPNF